MKKLFTFFLALLTVVSLQAQSTVDINGTSYPIDTTMHYQAGPGIWHTRYTVNIGSNVHHCYILEVDLTNPYNTIEEWQSSEQFGKTQKMADAYTQMSAENHRPIGGVNCNFWVVSSQNTGYNEGLLGQSFAGTARNGVLIGNPDDWNLPHGDRGYVMVDRDKKVHIEEMMFGGGIITKNNETLPIQEVNRTRVNPLADEIVVFNEYTGRNGTRATDGVEVVFSAPEWKINGDMTCTVLGINNTGGTVLTAGQGVLQGRGKFKASLEALEVGETFTMQLWVIGRHDANFQPDILQMVTGNCLVMRDGVINDRNTNEDYNNRNYPRTMLATNNEGNKFWMMVAQLPGMYTAQMCALLKHAGATYAAGMDGGGSAQMCMDGQVLNPTTEGVPRAIANSIWVLSTAPDDSVVTRISTQARVMRLPKYGVYDPTFVSYNQYDVLISLDQPDVVLSCPDSTGYIGPNGEFVCLGNGTLTATYGDAQTTVEVQIIETSGISIRLDSVLVMDDTDYAIEVAAHTAHTDLSILSGALTWEVADKNICTIDENGLLNGLQNGRTEVYGTLDGTTDTLIVNVEIPESRPYLYTDMQDLEDKWTITTSPATLSGNTQWIVNEDGKMEIKMNYTAGRAANTNFEIGQKLYALPTFLEIRYQSEEFPFDKIATEFYANNNPQNSYNITIDADQLTFGKQTNSILINLKELLEQGDDIAIYPITWYYLKFFYDTSREKKEYRFVWDGIYLHYGNDITLGTTSLEPSAFAIYPNPSADMLHIRGIEQATNVILYDLQGRTVVHKTLVEDGTIDINNLTEGTYLLHIGNETIKVIKK